jgi:hypothetical protein
MSVEPRPPAVPWHAAWVVVAGGLGLQAVGGAVADRREGTARLVGKAAAADTTFHASASERDRLAALLAEALAPPATRGG